MKNGNATNEYDGVPEELVSALKVLKDLPGPESHDAWKALGSVVNAMKEKQKQKEVMGCATYRSVDVRTVVEHSDGQDTIVQEKTYFLEPFRGLDIVHTLEYGRLAIPTGEGRLKLSGIVRGEMNWPYKKVDHVGLDVRLEKSIDSLDLVACWDGRVVLKSKIPSDRLAYYSDYKSHVVSILQFVVCLPLAEIVSAVESAVDAFGR